MGCYRCEDVGWTAVGMPAPAVPGGGFTVQPLELPPLTAEPAPAQKGGFFSGWWGSSSDKKVRFPFMVGISCELIREQGMDFGSRLLSRDAT